MYPEFDLDRRAKRNKSLVIPSGLFELVKDMFIAVVIVLGKLPPSVKLIMVTMKT